MTGFISSSAAAVLGLAVGFAGVWTAVDFSKPPERHLDLALLEYVILGDVGHVKQQVVSSSGTIIPADWRARIERETDAGATRILCDGSGRGDYNGEVSVWSLDDWTFDDCPDVARIGDFFEVSWTYQNSYGFIVTIGGRYRLDSDGNLIPTS